MADFQAALEHEMNGEAMPASDMPAEEVGVTFMSPGISTYTTLDFESGNYIFICHIPSPEYDMQPHFTLGMIQEVKVP